MWQPIETAPKDGTTILLVDAADNLSIVCGWWEKEWRDYGDIGCNGQIDFKPTHWMPLPDPPKLEK